MLARKDTNICQRTVRDPLYGQLVIGPPGSGKTTYCHRINEFYTELERKVAVVNLDPANEQMSYNAQVDIVSFCVSFSFFDFLILKRFFVSFFR